MMKYLLLLPLFIISCAKKETETVTNIVTNTIVKESPSFTCDVYDLSTGVTNMPDFSSMTPIKSLKLTELNAPVSNDVTIFPLFAGTTIENYKTRFGMVCKAKLNITKEGTYRFRLRSDDGSKLFLNSMEIINYDGLHGVGLKSVNVTLLYGTHDLQLKYFANDGDKALILSWLKPGASFESIITSFDLKD